LFGVMAEEKQEQGTNPPKEQPNVPLPSESYSSSFQLYSTPIGIKFS